MVGGWHNICLTQKNTRNEWKKGVDIDGYCNALRTTDFIVFTFCLNNPFQEEEVCKVVRGMKKLL